MAPTNPSNEDILKRLLYICTIKEIKYCSGGPKYAVPSSVDELISDFFKDKEKPFKFLDIVVKASEDPLLPHRSQLFYVLAKALCADETQADIKPKICETVLKICKSDQDFFDFIQHVSQLRTKMKTKLPNTVNKAICKYYLRKSPEALVQSLSKCNGYHGWTHKDLLRLGHLKPEGPEKSTIIQYIFDKNPNDECMDANINALISTMDKYAQLRKATDAAIAVPLIQELKVSSLEQVGVALRNNAEVWAHIIPYMPLLHILQALPKMYKLGFLKKDSITLNKVLDAVTSSERIKASGIHPLQIFIFLKNFERGGKPLDPQLLCHLRKTNLGVDAEEEEKKIKKPNAIKCAIVTNQINKCMSLACSNVQPLGKRILITIDTTDKMDTPCLHYKNISGTELAAAFVWYMMRTEKDVTVAAFKDNSVVVLQLDKKGDMKDYIEKFRDNRSKYLVFNSPIEWASSQEKRVDIFLNIIQHHKSHNAAPPDEREKTAKLEEVLSKYRKKMHLPNTKLVTVCAFSRHLSTNAHGMPNMFDVAGLDLGVPKIVEAFCRNNFS